MHTEGTPTFHDLLNQAILAYAELVQLNPKGWEGQTVVAELNESMDLDPTGLTTFLLLRGMMDSYTSAATFTVKDALTDLEGLLKELEQVRSVVRAIENPQAVQEVSNFQALLRQSMLAVGADEKEIKRLFKEPANLGELRRDALRSAAQMEVHQFTQGRAEYDQLRLNETVFEFWNINSLLRLLSMQNIGGVTLCLIRDPAEVMASFFALAVKNGDNITILTDREKTAHPAFWEMSRRPDRVLDRRMRRNWFPYHLLKLKPNARSWGWTPEARTALVPSQQKLIPLSPLSKLEAPEIAWLVMVHTLVSEKYGRQNYQLPQLSYTGEMVKHPHALVSPNGALIVSGSYKPLEVQPFTAKEVTAETTAPQWGHRPIGHNEWMVDEFKDQVPDEILNPLGESEIKLLRAAHTDLVGKEKKHDFFAPYDEKYIELRTFDPLAFGTVDSLEKDRLWTARMNQCRVVQALAERKWKAEKEQVKGWYRYQMRRRRDFFIEAAVRGTLKAPTRRRPPRGLETWGFVIEPLESVYVEMLEQRFPTTVKESYEGYWGASSDGFKLGEYNHSKWMGYECAVDPNLAAVVFTRIRVTCGEGIAFMFGLELEDLPIWLRNYQKEDPYTGNSILDRIDPSDWALKNPARDTDWTIYVHLSKREYNRIRRQLGLHS